MVSVIGHWEIGYNTPILEAPMWAWPLRDFDVRNWHMWPVTGVQNPEPRVTLTEHDNIQQALDHTVGTRVFVEPRNPNFPLVSADLPDFEHPEDAIYIFGSAHFNPTVANMRAGDQAVTLPTVRNDGVLFPHQVLVAVLYDRLVKSWQ